MFLICGITAKYTFSSSVLKYNLNTSIVQYDVLHYFDNHTYLLRFYIDNWCLDLKYDALLYITLPDSTSGG